MPEFATFSSSKNGTGLFTPEEVRQLMRVEFERSQRYRFPVSCLMVQIDRLDAVTTVHGEESKQEMLHSVVELVKNATRAGDLLGYLVEDKLLVLLPHTTSKAVVHLAQRLLDGARELRFSNDGGGTIRLTLSVGISHNQHPDARSFEALERVAAEGVAVADMAGGDRFVETELYLLHEKKVAREPQTAPAPTGLVESVGFDSPEYRQRLQEMIAVDGDLEQAAAALAEEILARALREAEEEEARREALQAPPTSSEDEYKREIDKLRRRVAKLTESLGLTEQELARARQMKAVDNGIASIYDDVQGLSDDDVQGELKKALMENIFQANLDLQQSIAPKQQRKGA